jgi:Glycosyl transferase family 2
MRHERSVNDALTPLGTPEFAAKVARTSPRMSSQHARIATVFVTARNMPGTNERRSVNHTDEAVDRLTPGSADSSMTGPGGFPEPLNLEHIAIPEQDGFGRALSLATPTPHWQWATPRQNGTGSAALREQEADQRSRRSSTDFELRPPRVAVLVPCLNEETTVADVVRGFVAGLPAAEVYVYDNGSTDQTAQVAREAGAIIRTELRPGKGNVVRRMFSEVTADVYLLVDGDGTYDPRDALEMVRRVWNDGCDMVVGRRMAEGAEAYRRGHRAGNAALTQTVSTLFGRSTNDILSGYRAVSRAYVNSFPMKSSGFEIETEMTIHALSMQMPVAEVDTRYTERPVGSYSKLRTVPDGIRILRLVLRILRDHRPVALFGTLAALFACVGAILLATGAVSTTSPAPLGFGFLAVTCFALGLVMESIAQGRRELKQLMYLSARVDPWVRPREIDLAASQLDPSRS